MSPNAFTTPRSVGVGEVQHTLAMEVIARDDTRGTPRDGDILPMLPSYTARIGLAEPLELGLHAAHLTSLGVDLKYNPLCSEGFDLAIDPGAQAVYAGGEPFANSLVYYLHAPLLLGFNVQSSTTIVVTPGLSMAIAPGFTPRSEVLYSTRSRNTFLGRLGLGGDFRVTPRYGVMAEATVLAPFDGSDDLILFVGFAFKFGAMPAPAARAQNQ